jgi:hypothetical protein
MDGFFARQQRSNSKVSSLCYCHDSVMEEYARYCESRVGEAHAGAQAQALPESAESNPQMKDDYEKSEVLQYLSGIIGEIKTLSAKQYISGIALEGMSRVLARLEEILCNLESGTRVDSEALERDLGIIDEILVEDLSTAIPAEQMNEWEKEAKVELKVYRKRLPKEMYDKIHRSFLRGKIHQKFGIGELTLFRL